MMTRGKPNSVTNDRVCIAAENLGTLPTDIGAPIPAHFQVTINKNALASDAPIAAKKMADPGG
jgi:hypothetical protein